MDVPAWWTRTIEAKDTGADVAVVQRRLGAYQTGEYDEQTQQLVRGLQKAKGLEVTGSVDKETAIAVGERKRKGLTPGWFTRTIRLWDEGDDVREARKALGFTNGDNRHDPDSEAAVRRYQSEHGLALTGEIDEGIAKAIGVE